MRLAFGFLPQLVVSVQVLTPTVGRLMEGQLQTRLPRLRLLLPLLRKLQVHFLERKCLLVFD